MSFEGFADNRWPKSHWKLTAPESYALLYGPKAEETQVFKLALLELVARGWLEIDEIEQHKASSGRARNIAALGYGARRHGSGGRPLDAVLELFEPHASWASEGGGSGLVPVSALALATRSRYGSFKNYVEVEVMPALAARGLYQKEERRILGLFPTSRWEITRTGEAARAELEGNRSLGRDQFRRWVDSNPSQALAFLGLTGSSVLLMEELHPDIRRLREREHSSGEAAVSGSVIGPHGDPETGEDRPRETVGDSPGDLDPAALDAPALDIGSFDFDLGAFDGIEGATSSIDSEITDTGGGWGGDGGGGGGG